MRSAVDVNSEQTRAPFLVVLAINRSIYAIFLLRSHLDTTKLTFIYDGICDLNFMINSCPRLDNWKQAEPSGCATKCGVAAGKSGTPGAVTCSTTSCDPDAKPAAKQCPKTVDCGTFDTDMRIMIRDPTHTPPPALRY